MPDCPKVIEILTGTKTDFLSLVSLCLLSRHTLHVVTYMNLASEFKP